MGWVHREGGKGAGVLMFVLTMAGVCGLGGPVQADMAEAALRRLLEQGSALAQQKQFAQAIAVYRRYLAEKPKDDTVRATLAKVLSWAGQWDEAEAGYRSVLSRYPRDHDSRVALARVLSWKKNYDESRREYEQVLRVDPKQAGALTGLADVLVWSGHPDQAIPYYQRGLEATGDPEIAGRLRVLTAELAAAGARDLLEQGRQLEAARQYGEAAALYRSGGQRYPENDEVRSALARVLSWQGDYVEATALYREVVTRRPADQDLRTALARVLSWQRQFSEAQALYEQVVREAPQHTDARRGLAEVAHWQGNRIEAVARYQVLAAETHDPDIEQQLRKVQSELLVSPRAAVGQGGTELRLPYRDYAKIGYGPYFSTRTQPTEHDGLFEVAKPIGDQTVVVRAESIHRFGSHDLPLAAEFFSPLWKRAWGYVAAQGTVNPHFAPNYSVVGEMAQGLGSVHDALAPVEVSFGYRRVNYKRDDINIIMPGLTIFLPFNFWLVEKIYAIPNTGAMTLSSQLTWRPADRVQIFASGAFGTSSERILIRQDFARAQGWTIQGGGTVPLTDRFSVEALVYYEDRGSLYLRRGGNVNLIYHW